MKVPRQEPIRLGVGHCCLCAQEDGRPCMHIGDIQLCRRHRTEGRQL